MCHANNEKGKQHMMEGIELPNQDKIRTLEEKETYKYGGILEADSIKQVEMKEKFLKSMVRVLANGPRDLGSIPGRVIPKTQKMVLDASLLNTQHYKVRIKGIGVSPGKGVAPSPIPWCSSYQKESLWVTLDNDRQLYFISRE